LPVLRFATPISVVAPLSRGLFGRLENT
jgi:hypothetical protein